MHEVSMLRSYLYCMYGLYAGFTVHENSDKATTKRACRVKHVVNKERIQAQHLPFWICDNWRVAMSRRKEMLVRKSCYKMCIFSYKKQ